MAYSLGLTLYNLANRREIAAPVARPDRPPGRLIWVHVPGLDHAPSVLELARRLSLEDGVCVLITCATALVAPNRVVQDGAPADTPAETRAFLRHWQPDIILLADGELRPALLHEAQDQAIPVIIVQGRVPYLLRDRDGWYPGLVRGLLHAMAHVLTVDETAARAFRKAGAMPTAVEVAGRLEEPSAVLPHTEAERASLAEMLAARPVWFAAGLATAEEDACIVAHRRALRLTHRLLLIVATQETEQAEALAKKMEVEQGWNVALRSSDQEPGPEVEVLIADSAAELGLWYRLAPITFLGGSLLGDGSLRNPMEGAALGSSLICGPRTGAFETEFGRLGAARALRVVASADELPDALSELLAPDRAARLANAAWAVASDGAEVTDHVIALIHRIIDGSG